MSKTFNLLSIGVPLDSTTSFAELTVDADARYAKLDGSNQPFTNPIVSAVPSATEPASPLQGMVWLDTASSNLYVYYGTDWWNIGTLTNPDSTPTTALLTELGDALLTELGDYLLQEA